jgi:transcriptional regulator with XRE-family HTH domain
MSRVLPEDYSPAVAKRLRQVRSYLGLKAAEMADGVEVSRGYWSELENAKAAPGPKLLSALERVFKINPAWLLRKEGQAFIGGPPESAPGNVPLGKQVEKFDSSAHRVEERRADYLVSSDARQPGGDAHSRGSASPLLSGSIAPVVGASVGVAELLTLPPAFEVVQPRSREYVVIPNIEQVAHAGRERVRRDVQRRIAASQLGVLAMDRAWMADKLGRSDGGFATVEVSGNSMMPTLFDGDTIVIDTLIDRIRGDGIYVLRRGEDELMVKRILLDPVDESAVIKSDNESYGSKELQPATVRELRVVGKMVWPRLR